MKIQSRVTAPDPTLVYLSQDEADKFLADVVQKATVLINEQAEFIKTLEHGLAVTRQVNDILIEENIRFRRIIDREYASRPAHAAFQQLAQCEGKFSEKDCSFVVRVV